MCQNYDTPSLVLLKYQKGIAALYPSRVDKFHQHCKAPRYGFPDETQRSRYARRYRCCQSHGTLVHYVHPGTSAKAPGDKPHADSNLKLATEREQTSLRSVAVGAACSMAIDPKESLRPLGESFHRLRRLAHPRTPMAMGASAGCTDGDRAQ